MSCQSYAVIDASNIVVNVLVHAIDYPPPNPHPAYPNHTIVACDGCAPGYPYTGWTYVNCEFVAPPPPITVSDLQTQLHELRAQFKALQALLPVAPVVEPVVEPVVAPVVEPVAEPVVEPAVEPSV